MPPIKTVSITLAICSRNRLCDLQKTLASLRFVQFPQDCKPEILLIDNGSSDNSYQVMEKYRHPHARVRAFVEPKIGLSNARNCAVNQALGEVIVFTDDDVRFPEDWVEGMVRPILEERCDLVGGAIRLSDEAKRPWMTQLHRGMLASTEGIDPRHPSRVVGAAMAIRKSVFDDVGLFDPKLGAGALGAGEETAFAFLAAKRGYVVGMAHDNVLEHHPDVSRLSPKEFLKYAKRMGRSEGYANYHVKGNRRSPYALWLVAVWFYTRLVMWRLKRRLLFSFDAGALDWELRMVRRIFRMLQEAKEHNVLSLSLFTRSKCGQA